MHIEVWSDVVCPWCYIGKRRLEQALETFEHAEDVTVTWRSFELDPAAPESPEGDYVTRLARKYGQSPGQAQRMLDDMTCTAAGVGLDFHFETARGGNTFDAHRLLHLGAAAGRQGELKEHLLRATFSQGIAISEHGALTAIALRAGLASKDVEQVLSGTAYGPEVRADEQRAAELGIDSVPFFVLDAKYGMPGAQPPEVLLAALRQAWTDRARLPGPGGPAASTEGDSCAV